ncbi:squalene synthase HpnC [Microvirga massiliensis]|uniref:squalene synthase HpnC n=1 Tax=Microvirga massiliensis TaxID=1033741 RepID=UPI00062BA4CB|nr:squalene synthase HpnC [Microvirga massiliensis]
MITASEACSGKSHRDENFPVASRLLQPSHRPPILAFYRFVRAADDVADHPTLPSDEKLALLDYLEHALTGRGPTAPEAEPLRRWLVERDLPVRHALDLLQAFRLDVRKTRYADWPDLMSYCALSAMPVGRFVLDVHGEPPCTWPASDALCAALQVINHLRDCGKDYRTLDRVYVPADFLATYGISVEALCATRACPQLRACIADLADRAAQLLDESAPLPGLIADMRLGLEVAAIRRLAATLLVRLRRRDPLSEPVQLGRAGFAFTAMLGVTRGLVERIVRRGCARLLSGRQAS